MGMKAIILGVDDDEQLLKLLDQVLSGLGVEVCAVESGQRAAELVGKDKFDGVFLDWKMPKMTISGGAIQSWPAWMPPIPSP